MKCLITIATCILLLNFAKAQTITPLTSNEFCPKTEYTFTAILPKPYSSMIANGGCYITQLPQVIGGTTITFKGIFDDVNAKQTFSVIYNDGTQKDFEFKKIKSLLFGTCQNVLPNLSIINAPRCQIGTFNISFANLQYLTQFESPALCFGTVTNYQYLLPANWKLGSTVSTGSNWIGGNNNVTITTDLSTGILGSVQIRPVNTTCGAALTPGSVVGIPVSRPEPILTITANSQDYICSNGTASYTINGMPATATVQWSVSNPSQVSILSGGTSSTVTVKNITASNVTATLTATVTDCVFPYPITHDISLGIPKPNPIFVVSIDAALGKLIVESDPPLPGASSYNWYKDGVLQSTHGSSAIIPIKRGVCDIAYGILVEALNGCGKSAQTYIGVYVPPCAAALTYSMTVSPNPTNAVMNLNISKVTNTIATTSTATNLNLSTHSQDESSKGITRIVLYDFNTSAIVKQWTYSEIEMSTYNLGLTGINKGQYVLKVDRDNQTMTSKIIVQ